MRLMQMVAAGVAVPFVAMCGEAVAAGVDATIIIDQASALTGNVTPGDAPGFPVTLSLSGSYRLGSNLGLSTEANGIEATAAEITIDFNGFKMSGGDVGKNGVVGFQCSLTVHGGTIRAFKKNGLNMSGNFSVVDDMRVIDNIGYGYFDNYSLGNPTGALITRSTFSGNYGGISCWLACHVEGNNISANTHHGVYFFNQGGMLLGNTVDKNGSFGAVVAVTGVGNNTIIGNGLGSVSGDFTPLQPNACTPACP